MASNPPFTLCLVVLELGPCTPHFYAHWVTVRLLIRRGYQRKTERLKGEKGQTPSCFFPVFSVLAVPFRINYPSKFSSMDNGNLFHWKQLVSDWSFSNPYRTRFLAPSYRCYPQSKKPLLKGQFHLHYPISKLQLLQSCNFSLQPFSLCSLSPGSNSCFLQLPPP